MLPRYLHGRFQSFSSKNTSAQDVAQGEDDNGLGANSAETSSADYIQEKNKKVLQVSQIAGVQGQMIEYCRYLPKTQATRDRIARNDAEIEKAEAARHTRPTRREAARQLRQR